MVVRRRRMMMMMVVVVVVSQNSIDTRTYLPPQRVLLQELEPIISASYTGIFGPACDSY